MIQIVKKCYSLDSFIELIDEIKCSKKAIFYNGKKQDKRKNLTADFDDIFDNNIPVRYFCNKTGFYVLIGDYNLKT